MPYKFEIDKIKLSETQDRRKKLTESQKQKIKELYSTGHFSLNQLAKQFEISKKSILQLLILSRMLKLENIEKKTGKDGKKQEKKEIRK